MDTIIIAFLVISFSSIHIVLSGPIFKFQKLDLPSTSTGPETITFDSVGRGPYTGISDGRIVRYNGSNFIEVYITSPNRSSLVCDGKNNPAIFGRKCGRPIGIDFHYDKNLLYITDAYKGLLVGTDKRLAVQLATEAEGMPFKFPDGLNVDQLTGNVYFTDASSVYELSQLPIAVLLNDSTGRLLKYNPITNNVSVLLRGLGGAAGVAVSSDGSFVLVTEYITKRIQKFWLKGPMAFKSQVIINLQGRPDNIKKTPTGDSFWVAVTTMNLIGRTIPTAIEITGNGTILRTLSLDHYYFGTPISEFNQRGSYFYAGSLQANFVGLLS
ncbi:protein STRICTOSIDINE SYNTHASE-LIKE 12-like [Humulus lupulus]|uniref:protein STRICTOSIDINE SYNTHASE-LIKE 12-like n=1 Tax=Humulus lupulus TaxID=3486 RepID=UPI002B4072AC|nr:protein STRICTOSIDINE SYNTHASE-LIKE 12-like [Humulus lupulus]